MLALAKVSSNGQITIPSEVRKALGVLPGGKVLFYQNAAGEIVIANPSSDALVIGQKAFAGTANQMGLSSTDDVDALIDQMRGRK